MNSQEICYVFFYVEQKKAVINRPEVRANNKFSDREKKKRKFLKMKIKKQQQTKRKRKRIDTDKQS